MGEMIGNIAHQWRQPLSSISITASNIKLKQNLNESITKEELYNDMAMILSKTQYLSDTIDTFRGFLKEEKEQKNIVIQERLDLVLKIVSSTLTNSHIELKSNYNELDPISLNMVVGELDQVLINIINNAKDVLIEKKIQKPWIKLKLILEKNKIIISIEDNGQGIPENIKDKIFEPYFSTKHQSQGTGLGLHMSYKIIVESLKGKIYTENTQNGAKFYIELPL
jgi:signal transduction histidine kinase